MRMPQLPRSVWLLGGAALLLPVATGTAVLVAHGQVAHTSENLERLAAESREAVAELHAIAARSPDPDALRRLEKTVEQQCDDARKPAIVIAELSAACARIGVRVESIRPVRLAGSSPPAAAGPADNDPTTGCELTLRADCATLGRLLDDLRGGRLPLRITAMTLDAEERGPDKPFGVLRADITVETFRASPSAKTEGRP